MHFRHRGIGSETGPSGFLGRSNVIRPLMSEAPRIPETDENGVPSGKHSLKDCTFHAWLPLALRRKPLHLRRTRSSRGRGPPRSSRRASHPRKGRVHQVSGPHRIRKENAGVLDPRGSPVQIFWGSTPPAFLRGRRAPQNTPAPVFLASTTSDLLIAGRVENHGLPLLPRTPKGYTAFRRRLHFSFHPKGSPRPKLQL